jgi:hypothetical protein
MAKQQPKERSKKKCFFLGGKRREYWPWPVPKEGYVYLGRSTTFGLSGAI